MMRSCAFLIFTLIYLLVFKVAAKNAGNILIIAFLGYIV